MPQFVYFARDKADLPACAFDSPPSFAVAQGPGGESGWLASADADCVRYSEESQEWAAIADGVWVGMQRSAPPTPIDLARSEQLPGETLTLADRGAWLVPRLRVHAGQYGWATALPSRMRRDAGQWVGGEVLPEHADADALGAELLDRMIGAYEQQGLPDPSGGMSFAQAADYAARVLAINYRVGPEELAMLGALPMDDRLAGVLRTACDYDQAEAWALGKLKAPAG